MDGLTAALAVRYRIEALHANRDFLVRDRLDFQNVQSAEIGDLLKAQAGIFNEPYGGRLWHQRFIHSFPRNAGFGTDPFPRPPKRRSRVGLAA